jgi:L-arabinose transport system ATP-binding protein
MNDDGFLQFCGISKAFPGVQALDDVSFSAATGSVHALIGENGAGKSTLLKILSGAYRPDGGGVRIEGRDRVFHGTSDAIAAGVAVIYQELHLAAQLSVAENLFLGQLPARGGIVDRTKLYSDTAERMSRLGETMDPGTRVGALPIAQRQMVEIAKALARNARIIAFDEPTSSLSDRETKRLFSIIRDLKAAGHVILYVSHRLEEIFDLCDAVTVFRDGRHVHTFEDMKGVTRDILVNRMVGRDIRDIYHYRARPLGEPALSVEGITGPGVGAPISFSVAKGEILGIFGLVGAGRSELLRLLFGAAPSATGSVAVQGEAVQIRSPADAIRSGIMLCPEDRKKEGIFPVRSVMENLNLSARRRHAYGRFVINETWERKNAGEQAARLSIKTPSLKQWVVNLSGGNQQKVILARWLSESVRIMLLDEPTRGIDVGARNEIYTIMYELTDRGIGVVMVSSDLPEVLGVSDRIIVMREGRVAATLGRAEATEELILRHALPAGPEGN